MLRKIDEIVRSPSLGAELLKIVQILTGFGFKKSNCYSLHCYDVSSGATAKDIEDQMDQDESTATV